MGSSVGEFVESLEGDVIVGAGTAPSLRIPPLELRLFGPLDVRVHGRPLPATSSRKGRWVLALLALRCGKEVDREWLAGTLWPESAAPQAFYNLRQHLSELRVALGGEAVRLRAPTRRTLCLDLSGAWSDVAAFDAALARGGRSSLDEAVALYRGPLIEGCQEEWILPEREAREQAYLRALERLATAAAERGDPEAVVAFLSRVLAADPLREGAARDLMAAHSARDEFAAAFQVYRDLRLRLHHEINASPAPATTALFEAIRRRAGPPAAPTRAGRVGFPCTAARLPRPLTRLVGRTEALAQVRGCLAGARLVTLTGAGGVGKTRLAIEAARGLEEEARAEVAFVDLAAVTDGVFVSRTVAAALALREVPGQSLEETLGAALGSRSVLLVLDNCEHLVGACAELVQMLLQACPEVRVLATSREVLKVAGEAIWRVPSLSLPSEAALRTMGEGAEDSLLEYAAIRLFAERAAQAESGFRLHGADLRLTAQICRRLDGIPLAIELAAARVSALPVREIARRLDDRFRLLTGGCRTDLPRHRTLKASIAWSYDLLSEPEQALLRRLSVFAGGWTLEAAEAVCGSTGEDGGDILNLLTSLIDRSLVLYEPHDEAGRYRLLETVRQYAWERSREARDETSERHGAYYLDLLRRWAPHLTEVGWARRVDREYPNVRLALEWSLTSPAHAGLAVAAARSLQRFWLLRGRAAEGREWWERALARVDWMPLALRGTALGQAGALALPGWDHAGARRLLHEAAALARLHADGELLAGVLLDLGAIAVREGDSSAAFRFYEESLAMARQAESASCAGRALIGIARVSATLRQPARAWACAEESVALFRYLGEPDGTAGALHIAGLVLLDQGDEPARAQVLLEESLALSRVYADYGQLAGTLARLGDLARQRGELARARLLFEEGLAHWREMGDQVGIASLLSELGFVALDEGDLAAAQALLEGSLVLRRAFGDQVGIARMLYYLGTIERLRGRLATARSLCEQALAMGRELNQPWVAAACLLQTGLAALGEDDPLEARQFITEALGIWRTAGDQRGLTRCLWALGRVAMAAGPPAEPPFRAARLFGAAAAVEDRSGLPLALWEQVECERARASVCAALDEEQFAAAWAAGRQMTAEEACASALEGVP